MCYYSDGITPLLFHCNLNNLEMIHWGHTGLTLEEHLGDYLGTENVKLLKIRIFINIICVCEKKHVSLQHTNNKINIID